MKKLFTLLVITMLTSLSLNAQLYVDSSGHTAVGDYLNTSAWFNVSPNSQSLVPNLVSLYSTSSSSMLQINNYTPASTLGLYNVVGVDIFCLSQPNRNNIGIRSYALNGDGYCTGSSYGLISKAGYCQNGWNYGVCTSLLGTHDGAGIYATVVNYPDGYQVSGQWAGYFNGNVKVVGTLTATTVTQTSDFRLKENIRQLEGGNLSKLMDMNVVKYRFKNYEVNVGDTATVPHYAFDDDNPILKSDHYGLIAQELKEIYPELVEEAPDGYLSINYIELIPILIKSVQELKAKVDELEANRDRAPIRESESTQLNQFAFPATLYQNNPNPFTENTIVRCLIPKEVSSAVLYIYDMNGRQIDSMIINERGEISLTIEGGSLDAGIYLYSLITDGTLIDTKRMILTK